MQINSKLLEECNMTPRYFALETKSIAERSSLTAAQGLLYLLPKRNTAHFLALKLILIFVASSTQT